MTPEREEQLRADWRGWSEVLTILDGVAALRAERDKWRNQHHAVNVDLMAAQAEIAERKAYGETQYKEWNYHLDISPSCNEGRLWRPTEDDGPRLIRMPNIDYSQEVLEALEEGPGEIIGLDDPHC